MLFGLGGLTISEEGGLEEVRESFLSWALSSAISARAAWSCDLSSAISLSLASMMQNLTFFRQGTEEQLGNKMKKAVNGCSRNETDAAVTETHRLTGRPEAFLPFVPLTLKHLIFL